MPNELNNKLNSEGVGAILDLNKPFIVVLYHPVTSEIDDMSNQINQVLKSTLESELQYVVLFPNSDSGTLSISSKIRSFRENNFLKKHRFFKHVVKTAITQYLFSFWHESSMRNV